MCYIEATFVLIVVVFVIIFKFAVFFTVLKPKNGLSTLKAFEVTFSEFSGILL